MLFSKLVEAFEGGVSITTPTNEELTIDQIIALREGLYSINGVVACPIVAVASFYNRLEDVELLDEAGNLIGVLCLVKGAGPVSLSDMTTWRFSAYLRDSSSDVLGQDAPHTFSQDYLAVKAERFDEYAEKYLSTSALWGGFIHGNGESTVSRYTRGTTEIKVREGLRIPSPNHHEGLLNALLSPSHFDRFLKKYHQLELWLDYAFISQLKGLGEDIRGASRIMSAYSSNEIDRLKYVVSSYCDDVAEIERHLNAVARYKDLAYEMFEEWNKNGNPISESSHNKIWEKIRLGEISEAKLKGSGLSGKGSEAEKYKKFITELASYWVYRMRCCIAHRKIGELIIRDAHEEFCVEFVEPLLDSLVNQALRRLPL